MLEDEQNLIARAKGGEAEAFGSLYDYYMPRIYRFILIKVSYREEAEDLTHQTFLKAWERIEQFTFQGYPFSSWLYRIARNTVIDHHRKVRPQQVDIDYVPQELLASESSPEDEMESRMEWEKLLSAIGGLKDIEQDVLIMRFVDEMTHKEIAGIVKKSEGAVKVVQHRALKKLREVIEK